MARFLYVVPLFDKQTTLSLWSQQTLMFINIALYTIQIVSIWFMSNLHKNGAKRLALLMLKKVEKTHLTG